MSFGDESQGTLAIAVTLIFLGSLCCLSTVQESFFMSKVAAIQMCSTDNIEQNLEEAKHLLTKAADNGAQLAVLPEMFAMVTDCPKKKYLAREIFHNGKIQSFLTSVAKELKIWIVAGTIPIAIKDSDKVKAACLIYDDSGNCIARYDKIHLFDVTLSENECYKESDSIEPGNEIVVINTPVGKLGVAVCYDIRFPLLFNQLFCRGVEILAVPAAFTIPTGEAHWQLLARARAVENFSYFIGSCQGGVHTCGRKTYGHSIIVNPWGEILQEATQQKNTVIYASIDLKKLHKIRHSIPVDKFYE